MSEKSQVFERNYQDYLSRISSQDFKMVHEILGIPIEKNNLVVPFLGSIYSVSAANILNQEEEIPNYLICVVLAQYILRCPTNRINHDNEWVAFTDFKKDAAFLNGNIFKSDCELVIAKNFKNRLSELKDICYRLNGTPQDIGISYDLAMRIDALPTISLLLLFNEQDDLFPAECKVLFQKHAEHYLDPESLAMVGISLAHTLTGYLK